MNGTIECKCGETEVYKNCQCPNDVTEQTGWIQDDDGYWICPKCQEKLSEKRSN